MTESEPSEIARPSRWANLSANLQSPTGWLQLLAGLGGCIALLGAPPFNVGGMWAVKPGASWKLGVIACCVMGFTFGEASSLFSDRSPAGRWRARYGLALGTLVIASAGLYIALAAWWRVPVSTRGSGQASLLSFAAIVAAGACLLLSWLVELRQLRVQSRN